MKRFYLMGVVLFHYMLVGFLTFSVPLLLLLEPPYLSIPLIVWIYHLGFGSFRCPLTTLENKLRRDLGMQPIKNFIYRYVFMREGG